MPSCHLNLDLKNAVRNRKRIMLKTIIESIVQLTNNDNEACISALLYDLELSWSEFTVALEEQEAVISRSGHGSLNELTDEYMRMNNSYVNAKIHATHLLTKLRKKLNGTQSTVTTTSMSMVPFPKESTVGSKFDVIFEPTRNILLDLITDQLHMNITELNDTIGSSHLCDTNNNSDHIFFGIHLGNHLHGLSLAHRKHGGNFKFDLLLDNAVHVDVITDKLISGERDQPVARQLIEQITIDEQIAENTFSNSSHCAGDFKYVDDLPFKVKQNENFGESFSMTISEDNLPNNNIEWWLLYQCIIWECCQFWMMKSATIN